MVQFEAERIVPGGPDPAKHDGFGSDLKPPCRNYIIHESVCFDGD